MLDTAWMTSFPVTFVTAVFTAEGPPPSAPDLAITVRGALGKAVLDIACIRPDRNCPACAEVTRCVVPTWYDPGRVGGHQPRPFALQVGVGPSPSTLHVFLSLPGVVPRPSLLVDALIRTAVAGLGADRLRYRLQRLVVHGDQGPVEVVADEIEVGPWPRPAVLGDLVAVPAAKAGLRVDLVTRTQLDRTRRRPEPADLLRACVRRIREVSRHIGVEIERRWPEPESVPGEWEDLRFEESSRWSQRQGERLDLSGWVGTLRLGPEAEAYADLLAAMQLMQVGSGTSAGLGVLHVEAASPRLQ